MTSRERKLWSALRELSQACKVTKARSTHPLETDPYWLADAMTSADQLWRDLEAEAKACPP